MIKNVPFKVRTVKAAPEFDAMPVAKIVDYPFETRDYKPFAQNIVCVGNGALHVRMWAFEASPAPSSALRGIFRIFAGKPELSLHISLCVGEESAAVPQCRVFMADDTADKQIDVAYTIKAHSGEDLQGIFWGASVAIPLSALEAVGGKTLTAAGDLFPGNFYKTCEDEGFKHYGSFYPSVFGDKAYSAESMGIFEIVDW